MFNKIKLNYNYFVIKVITSPYLFRVYFYHFEGIQSFDKLNFLRKIIFLKIKI